MSLTSKKVFFENNFNLIRLFAAAQVAHFHIVAIYGVNATSLHEMILQFFGLFPGVPIFFFISGFLISKSWESSRSWKDYAIKRLARIEPALVFSVFFALFLVYISGYMMSQAPSISYVDIFTLIVAKTTVMQFYNPEYLRAYGDGVLNGSLWTIIVEIQFYVLVPLLYLLFKEKFYKTAYLLCLILLFVLVNGCYDFFHESYSNSFLLKIAKVTFWPWFFMFLVGVFFQRHFSLLHKYLSGKFLWILPIYVCSCYLGKYLNFDMGNSLNPFLFMVLACLTFSAAYTKTSLAEKLLGKLDMSYGLYLYHMPIINYFLYLNFAKTYFMGFVIASFTILISIFSWYVIENPSLKYAKRWHRA